MNVHSVRETPSPCPFAEFTKCECAYLHLSTMRAVCTPRVEVSSMREVADVRTSSAKGIARTISPLETYARD
jgi:hypothetical protein